MNDTILLRTFREHEGDLLRFLGKRLGSQATASDVLYDLYLKLLQGVGPGDVQDGRAYLFSMAANLATDHLRVERRRGEILREANDIIWNRSDDLTPERHALARSELAHLEAVITGLSERQRQVFLLSRFEDRTQAEIAAELGIGITTVYKDLKDVMRVLLEARRAFRDADKGPGRHRT